MSDILLKLITPSVPNFISIQIPTGRREDGFNKTSIPIADLTDEQLLGIAKAWKIELIAKARARRMMNEQ